MRTFRLLGLLALLLAKGWSIYAQTTPILPFPTLDAENSQRWVVKFAPLSLFDPNNTIQFGIERMLSQRNSLQGEFGYGPGGMNLYQNSFDKQYSNLEIWRGRAEWRHYWHGGPIGNYIAVEGLYKQVNGYEKGSIGIGCDFYSTGCQYYQISSNSITKRVWGGHLKFGRQFRLSPDSNRWLMDFYGGIGIRGNTVTYGDKPAGFDFNQGVGLFDFFSPSNGLQPSLSYGIKIGYSF